MRNSLCWILGAVLIVNGLAMVFATDLWFNSVPSVPATGPLNGHFVRDVGCAYLVCGAALIWLVFNPAAWPAAMAGAAFQLLHAATHVWDLAADRETGAHFALDAVLVVVPSLLALWLAWPRAPRI